MGPHPQFDKTFLPNILNECFCSLCRTDVYFPIKTSIIIIINYNKPVIRIVP